MSDFTIKKGDTRPIIKATLSDASGALNLTGTTVKLVLRNASSGVIARRTCTLDDAALGKVSYAWIATPTDVATEASYYASFEVTYADTSLLSVPSSGYFTIDVVPNAMAV